VTKTFDINTITPIIACGHNDFGENKVQEAILKWQFVQLARPRLTRRTGRRIAALTRRSR
jgi:uncharacterized pyridoxal phosphate-containing UPF0001 family protein